MLELLRTPSTKRPEECYKFVLTRVIKALKRDLQKRPLPKHLSPESLFYEKYFRELAGDAEVSLADFYYPLTGSNKGRLKLNKDYFTKVFRSNAFVTAVLEFCRNSLVKDYAESIRKKIVLLDKKWNEVRSKHKEDSAEAERAILEYVMFNKRCKFPWSFVEVADCIKKTVALIKKVRKNK